MAGNREGSLEAPTRHALDWQSDAFYDETQLFEELERVFDVCHGCRRCFNLCNSFPTLFDAVDESESMEVDTVPKKVFWDVVDHCYLCDMCYMSKCPYVPPHEWNIDFPHLMLRAKAARFKERRARPSSRSRAERDGYGRQYVGRHSGCRAGRQRCQQAANSVEKCSKSTLGVHRDAPVPLIIRTRRGSGWRR